MIVPSLLVATDAVIPSKSRGIIPVLQSSLRIIVLEMMYAPLLTPKSRIRAGRRYPAKVGNFQMDYHKEFDKLTAAASQAQPIQPCPKLLIAGASFFSAGTVKPHFQACQASVGPRSAVCGQRGLQAGGQRRWSFGVA